MGDEIVEIMAQAMCGPNEWERANHTIRSRLRGTVRAQLNAAEAHGYEIRKRDPDMIAIKEIDTTRPIER